MSQQATKLKQGLSGLYEFLTVLLDGILDSLLDHFLEVIFGCEKKLTAIWNICSVKDRNEFNPTVCPKPQGFGMFRSWFYGYHFPTTEQQTSCLEALYKIVSKGFWQKDPKSFTELPIISLFMLFLEPEL